MVKMSRLNLRLAAGTLVLLTALLSAAAAAQPASREFAGEEGRAMVKQFLRDCRNGGAFFIATMDEDNQPRVRPFGAVAEYDGKLYICTGNAKAVYRQIKANPKVEISGVARGEEWIRLTATLVEDTRVEAKQAVLDQNPDLKKLYRVDDGVFAVFYFENAQAHILSFSGRDDKIRM